MDWYTLVCEGHNTDLSNGRPLLVIARSSTCSNRFHDIPQVECFAHLAELTYSVLYPYPRDELAVSRKKATSDQNQNPETLEGQWAGTVNVQRAHKDCSNLTQHFETRSMPIERNLNSINCVHVIAGTSKVDRCNRFSKITLFTYSCCSYNHRGSMMKVADLDLNGGWFTAML